jgi:hypothetical protein
MWSQVVADALGVPANVVAVWSQSGVPTAGSGPVTGRLSCGVGGAPRGIRTSNRQIRSLTAAVPAVLLLPPSPLVLVSSHFPAPTQVSFPACHGRFGGNLVAVSGHRRQTRRLVTLGVASAQRTRFPIWCADPKTQLGRVGRRRNTRAG